MRRHPHPALDAEVARVRRGVTGGWSAVRAALRAIEGETVQLRAMALTYISLFALVPALVVAFSVLQAFAGMDRIADRVHEVVIENLAVGARASIEPYLDAFVRNAHATSAGLVGAAILVYSAVTLFSNVERAVNDLWGIRRRRPLAQQAIIYWVGLTLGPLLLAGSVTLTAAARSFLASAGTQALAEVAGGLLTCAFFATLYQIVPFTRVRPGAAAVGGLAAGLAWGVAKWAYTFAVARIFRYHAIYGSVAAVPIFLFWLFVSWTILLFGARLAYVVQYRSSIISGGLGASRAGREVLAGQAMLLVARAYDEGRSAPDSGEVASRLGATAEEAGEALTALRGRGLLLALADGGLVPARPLERITLLEVRQAVVGEEAFTPPPGILAAIVRDVEADAGRRLEAISFRELCDRERTSPQPVQDGSAGASREVGRAARSVP